MCSRGISSPSLLQTRFCWIRAPSLSWSWWKRTSFCEVAGKSSDSRYQWEIRSARQSGQPSFFSIPYSGGSAGRRQAARVGEDQVRLAARLEAAVELVQDLPQGVVGAGRQEHAADGSDADRG